MGVAVGSSRRVQWSWFLSAASTGRWHTLERTKLRLLLIIPMRSATAFVVVTAAAPINVALRSSTSVVIFASTSVAPFLVVVGVGAPSVAPIDASTTIVVVSGPSTAFPAVTATPTTPSVLLLLSVLGAVGFNDAFFDGRNGSGPFNLLAHHFVVSRAYI